MEDIPDVILKIEKDLEESELNILCGLPTRIWESILLHVPYNEHIDVAVRIAIVFEELI